MNGICTVTLSLWLLLPASGLASSQADTADFWTAPWIEKAIPQHVSQQTYTGILDAGELQELVDAGSILFSARFTSIDGVGRPMATQAIIPTKRKRAPRHEFSRTAGLDANACASCHSVPTVGGAGDFTANVFVSEGFQHTDFDTTDPQFSNERNTNHLFGSGLVELLAREMTETLTTQRLHSLHEAQQVGKPVTRKLSAKGVMFGSLTAYPDGRVDTQNIDGVDHDLVVRPFSHKGVMTSLRQFTINALNHHHGMQAVERFGTRWTGEKDFDEDGVENEITAGDVSALVAWQATLPPPATLSPTQPGWQAAALAGRNHFSTLGCSTCHIPALPLDSLQFNDPGLMDAAGTLRQSEATDRIYDLTLRNWASTLQRNDKGQFMVPLFGDLKRHVIADQQVSALGNELLSQRFVERNEFMTTELWGVASTAPYGHRGVQTTLREIIEAHGGAARASRNAWIALPASEQNELIAWLKTLVIQP